MASTSMTVEDHARLYKDGSVPTRLGLSGVWRMDAISNANRLGSVAYLQFDPKPDGRLEAAISLLGLLEGSGDAELPFEPLPPDRLHAVPR
jgi:hypothetical protein